MSTSVRIAERRSLLWNLGLTIFFALLGAVYELFSHEVYSYYMIYAFALPLLLGVLPGCIRLTRFGNRRSGRLLRGMGLWNAGILTLTVGCAFHGVLEIYGTTNRLEIVYLAAGIALLLAGAISRIFTSLQYFHFE